MKRLLVVAVGIAGLLGCSTTVTKVVDLRRDVPRDRDGVVRARVHVSGEIVEAVFEDAGALELTVRPEVRYPWIFRPSLDWGITVAPLDEAPTASGMAEGTAFRGWTTFDALPLDGVAQTCFAGCSTFDADTDVAGADSDTDPDTDPDTDRNAPETAAVGGDVECLPCAVPFEVRLTREDAPGWLRARLRLVARASAGRSLDQDGVRLEVIDSELE